jgi:ATP-dependent DNA helicase DinG
MSDLREQALNDMSHALHELTEARGLRTRPSQNQMITSIAQVLLDRTEQNPTKGDNLIVIEAPTGTGKSFGYLLPAIPVAKKAGVKVVVATAVVALQEQLFEKDLPAIAKAMPFSFKYALAKGRGRFVCTSRLRSQVKSMEQLGLTDDSTKKKSKKKDASKEEPTIDFSVGGTGTHQQDAQFYQELLENFENNTWNGEQETLSINDERRKVIWPKITTDSAGCSGKVCKDYSTCSYYKARERWQDADVIVANHDLVMSDLVADGHIISKPDNTLYIFDEAHHLPQKAREAWSHSFKSDTLPKIFKEVPTNLEDIGTNWEGSACPSTQKFGSAMIQKRPELQQAGKDLTKLLKELDDMFVDMTKDTPPRESFTLDYTKDYTPLFELVEKTKESLDDYLSTITTLMEPIFTTRMKVGKITLHPDSAFLSDTEMNRVLGAFGFYKSRINNAIETLQWFSKDQPNIDKPPIAKWVTPDEKHKHFNIQATPTLATDVLPPHLYEKAWAVVHASATITSVGGFDLYKQKTGLCYYPNARMIKLDSPFDFQKNAKLVFGDMGANPSDNEAHTRRLSEVLPHLFSQNQDKGILVLFASKSQLEQVAARLPWEYRQLCKVQYEAPNQLLVENHKRDVDTGKRSILMGSQSFSEGLDLPGDWCSLVISTKLPFSMPDNPIDKTLAVWMESRGRNVFREISVPEASERLIQQAGRLLRREEDRGQFVLLDNRIMNKWNAYGKLMVESLPPFGRKKLDLTKVVYKSTSPVSAPQSHAAPAVKKPGLPDIGEYDLNLSIDTDQAPW